MDEIKQIDGMIDHMGKLYERLQSIQIFATENNIAGMYEAMTYAKTVYGNLQTYRDGMEERYGNNGTAEVG